MNAINVIHPYKDNGQWVFDDKSKDLDKEPFVEGADTLLDLLTNNAEKCTLIFAKMKFPSAQELLENEEPNYDGKEGTWYIHIKSLTPLWLCPALLRYFDKPPIEIYFKIEL